METHRIIYLYQRWSENSITSSEEQELSWLLQDEKAEELLKAHWDENWEAAKDQEVTIKNYETIFQNVVDCPQQKVKRYRMPLVAAASILITVGLSLFLYLGREQPIPLDQLTTNRDIAPGGNRATLTLANGKVITLSGNQNGIRMGDTVKYNDGTTLDLMPRQIQYATLTTPKGGQYQVVLPDGSKVWLNAASSLTYPSSFADAQERKVKLVGEAYFEIAHNVAQPFIVSSEDQDVQVLGTRFNISAFPDEKETLTTLVEGSIVVRPVGILKNKSGVSSLLMSPHQQSILNAHQFRKQPANIEQALAWKNGYFLFKDESIHKVMQDIAKWYDVDIHFEGDASDDGFNGMISRNKPISAVLKMLEETGAVHFKLKNKTIYVYQ